MSQLIFQSDAVNIYFSFEKVFVDFTLNNNGVFRGNGYAAPVFIVDFHGNRTGSVFEQIFFVTQAFSI